MFDFGKEISGLTEKASRELNDATDQYILAVFGTREAFEEVAHLYVLESYPIKLMPFEHDEYKDELKFIFSQQVRIRPKTPEELDGQLGI